MAKMVFDDTPTDYEGVDNASLLAMAHRYRPPEVARVIAQERAGRRGAPTPGHPHRPVRARSPPDPAPAYGLPYDDPLVWWGMGAQFPWQIVPAEHRPDQHLRPARHRPLPGPRRAEADHRDRAPSRSCRSWRRSWPPRSTPGCSSEVNTYTWRSPEVMLSTAQDWRKGQRSEQAQTSQATLDPDALVFTNHPAKDAPLTEADARSDSLVLLDRPGIGAALGAARQGQRLDLRAPVRELARQPDPVPPVREPHPRLLPDRALRPGRASRTAGPSGARATATSRSGRGGRPTGAPTRRVTTRSGSPSRSIWSPTAAPTTCGSPRSAGAPTGRARPIPSRRSSPPSRPRRRTSRRCRRPTARRTPIRTASTSTISHRATARWPWAGTRRSWSTARRRR